MLFIRTHFKYRDVVAVFQSMISVGLFTTPLDYCMPGFLVSPSPRICPSSCPLNQWCHPTISSFVTLFSCLQSFPASGTFPVSPLFASGASIGTSASVLPMSIQGWFPLGLTTLISLLFKGLSRVFSSTTVWKHQFFCALPALWSNSYIHRWLVEKPQLWLDRPLLAKWCLCFLIHCLGLS